MTSIDPARPVWFVTGGSSGFGLAIAKAAVSAGANVFITDLCRDDQLDASGLAANRHRFVVMDVRKLAQIASAVEECIDIFGRIDVLVNNAGFGLIGAVEEVSPSEYRSLFDVNFFGAAETTRAVLPQMRAAKQGHVVNISSIAGFSGAAGFGFYAASKFALEGYSESLARDVEHLGIRVTIVEPAALRTNFRGSSMARSMTVVKDYEASSGIVRDAMDRLHGMQTGDPDRAASVVVDAVVSGAAPLRLPLGRDAIVRVRAKLDSIQEQIDAWEHRTLDIDFIQPERSDP